MQKVLRKEKKKKRKGVVWDWIFLVYLFIYFQGECGELERSNRKCRINPTEVQPRASWIAGSVLGKCQMSIQECRNCHWNYMFVQLNSSEAEVMITGGLLLDALNAPSTSEGNLKHPCKSSAHKLVPLSLTLKSLYTAQIWCNLALAFSDPLLSKSSAGMMEWKAETNSTIYWVWDVIG